MYVFLTYKEWFEIFIFERITMETLEQTKSRFADHVKLLQDKITQKLRDIDPELQLTEDIWERLDYEGNPGGAEERELFLEILLRMQV